MVGCVYHYKQTPSGVVSPHEPYPETASPSTRTVYPSRANHRRVQLLQCLNQPTAAVGRRGATPAPPRTALSADHDPRVVPGPSDEHRYLLPEHRQCARRRTGVQWPVVVQHPDRRLLQSPTTVTGGDGLYLSKTNRTFDSRSGACRLAVARSICQAGGRHHRVYARYARQPAGLSPTRRPAIGLRFSHCQNRRGTVFIQRCAPRCSHGSLLRVRGPVNIPCSGSYWTALRQAIWCWQTAITAAIL